MAGITLEKGRRIYQAGQPMTTVHLITKGTVQVDYPGGNYRLGKGDIIGVCELCFETHFLSYYALEDTEILTYALTSGSDVFDDFLTKHPDVTRLFLLSMFHQINILLAQSNKAEINCSGLRQNLLKDYKNYMNLCQQYRIAPRDLEGIEEVTSAIDGDAPDLWLSTYYLGLKHLYSGDASKNLLMTHGVSLGMLRKGSLDFRNAFNVLDDRYHYRQKIISFYFNEQGNDLFDMMVSLYYRLGNNNEDAIALKESIDRLIQDFEKTNQADNPIFASRIQTYRSNKLRNEIANANNAASESGHNEIILTTLNGSMNTILEFAKLDADFCNGFRANFQAYKALPDKLAMDTDTVDLRHELTDDFYTIYSAVFENSLNSYFVSPAVKMFLYFGYIDEELAGKENLLLLYNLAMELNDTSDFGIYTFYHWLLAIYNGQKMPSRNEFEKDFSDYVMAHKQSGLSTSELLDLENNPMNKVRYELQNMFPLANKITCGTITTFCPFFMAESVLKDLNNSLVTVSRLTRAIDDIKAIDYSAFYRESLDYENIEVMGKKTIHLEFIPDIILMPNVGIRGAMWQEIEGKKRNTPGRMCLSIFHLENLIATMTRLTGEFRWDLCKRFQGARWNDVSTRSLTSEYYDYIQFYRRNHDLTAEAKEKIHTSLQRAKNSFKEMFIRDYMIWVMFEGNGSPRLNKISRRILHTYCPFSAELSKALSKNPLYADMINRQQILNKQQLHQLDNLRQKLTHNNQPIPATLESEYLFLQGM